MNFVGTKNKESEFKIIWGNRYLIIRGINYDTDFHSHHAIQISLSLSNPISLNCGEVRYEGEAILVKNQTKHALDRNEDSVIVLVEPYSLEGQALKRKLQNDSVVTLSLPSALRLDLSCDKYYQKNHGIEKDQLFTNIVSSLLNDDTRSEPMDDRIRACLEHIEAGVHENDFSVHHLAQTVYLSDSRLQHLFKKQAGVTLSSYIQWFKVLKSAKCVIEGQTMTAAAFAGGFADLAHFSRCFRGMFGKPLSHYLKDSRLVQVIFV
jgi:AraC-like DNA-binding protein